jgi:hypothetical protein
MSQGIEDLKEEVLALKARVEELAKQVADLQSPTTRRHYENRPSPYDASVKRGSRGSSCPHKPQYRNCWCG